MPWQSKQRQSRAAAFGSFFDSWVANSAAIEDFAVGQFVFDNPAGLRSFPYSTDA